MLGGGHSQFPTITSKQHFDLWHTLLVGRSGSGKSSALFALLSLIFDAQMYGAQRPLVCDDC